MELEPEIIQRRMKRVERKEKQMAEEKKATPVKQQQSQTPFNRDGVSPKEAVKILNIQKFQPFLSLT